MHPALILLPIVASLVMWLAIRIFIRSIFRPSRPYKIAGIKIQGILPKYQPLIAQQITDAIIIELSANEEIKNFIAGPEVLKKIMPSIETHLDHFLNVKLKEALPVISIFIGERVISQLKELFMNELQLLFPSVMSQLFDGLQHNPELTSTIYVKLSSVSVQEMEKKFYNSFRKEIRRVEIAFAVLGFITGIFQILVVLLLYK